MFSRSAQDSTPVWRIYNKDWRLLRSEFESFKLYFYAVTWARSIFQGMTQRKTDEDGAEETQAETYVCKASCAMHKNVENHNELVFTVPDGIPQSWRAGNTVVLSRSNPSEDGRWNHTMKVHKIRWGQITVLEPK